ncbi:hypothetical protein, partial [Paraburkholderia sediminicola]|uniref:hypothetical protein n=1 Tax=Paraburkholderia sediminicola TaxID=458836 RepID=UPI0038BC7D8F
GSLQQGSLPGANSPNSPKIRPVSERSSHLPAFRLTLGKLTTPRRRVGAKSQHDAAPGFADR